MTYRVLDHTGDIGIEVESKTLDGLFQEAGLAMFQEMIENFSEVQPRITKTLSLQEHSLEDLFLGFLSELLFYFDAEGFIPRELEIRVDPHLSMLSGTARGEPLNPDKHKVRLGIKAVTYHMLRIEKREDGWLARVIFDV